MGYSIAVRCKNEELRKKMLAFLSANYTLPSKFLKINYDCSRGPLDDGLSYDHGKCSIGFDYGPLCDPERHYVYCVLYWIALKVGKTRNFKKLGASVPHIVYDGHETWPVLNSDEWKDKVPKGFEWAIVSKCGYRSPELEYGSVVLDAFNKLSNFYFKKAYSDIESELQRLDSLWEQMK